jgi:sulfur-carrier protein
MITRIRIPVVWITWTNQEEYLEVTSRTVGEAIDELLGRYPRLKERLLDAGWNLHRYVNVFVNEEDIRYSLNLKTPSREAMKWLWSCPRSAGNRLTQRERLGREGCGSYGFFITCLTATF